jgi:hypothetical protein
VWATAASTTQNLFDTCDTNFHIATAVRVWLTQNLFDTCMDANSLVAGIEKEEQLITAARRVTPKMFAHSIKSKCLANPQHIVLPEVRRVQLLLLHAAVTP